MAPLTFPTELLQPRSATELIDLAVQVLRRHYWRLIDVAVLALLPYFAFDIIYRAPGSDAPLLVMLLTTGIVGTAGDVAVIAALLRVLEGGDASPRAALGLVRRRLWPIVAAGAYRAVLILGGLFLVVVPGLYVLAIYAVLAAVIAAEPDVGARAALRRSSTLTAGHRLRALGCVGVPYVMSFFANSLVTDAVAATVRALNGGAMSANLTGMITGTVTAMLLTPVVAVPQALLYLDLRVRKEALDIEADLASPKPRQADLAAEQT
jgi:hypothetical protein